MIHIPSSEIKQPGLHADTLGFTFIWQGHFLRGIFPQSVGLAKSYFETGFLDEVVNKGLFPKTWISEYENEQFGMIIEHEMIFPVLYATEWNFSMLKDAALMVLEIAQTGWKFGYNMIDCHKLNVLFRNNHPIYIDLGSFIPRKEGCTGWKPYWSFLQSYYYILDIWKDGACQIAKRTMSPGVMMNIEDYYLYKKPVFRHFRFLFHLQHLCSSSIALLAISDMDSIKKKRSGLLIVKNAINRIKPHCCQRFKKIKKRVSKINIKEFLVKSSFDQNNTGFILDKIRNVRSLRSITFIDNPWVDIYGRIINDIGIDRIISIQQNEQQSEMEYLYLKDANMPVCSTYFQLMNGGFLIRGKFPENRLTSDIVVLTNFNVGCSEVDIHNSFVLLKNYAMFSKEKTIIVFFKSFPDLFMKKVGRSFVVLDEWHEQGDGLMLRINESKE